MTEDGHGNTTFADGSVLYGVDVREYVRAIEAAPPGTMIVMGELKPLPWMKCDECGAEMDEVLTRFHTHTRLT